jgi:radical SAM superfamily enzyme YgiQ (UPF0313 family)
MKILLLEPRLEHGVATYKNRFNPFSKINTNPSITLPMIAALTPNEHMVKMINENYEIVDFDKKFDIVAISVLTITANRAYELAKVFRKKGSKIILGGYHVSALPQEAIKYADAVVIGEAESTWPKLIKDFEKNRLKNFYVSDKPDLKKLTIPKRNLYYDFLAGAVQATRGCPVGCDFCPTSWLLGKRLRKRPIKEIVDEIKTISNKLIIFRDASLTIDKNYSKALFKAMKDLDKKWIANGNINVLGRDKEFLKLAKESGCIQWFIGLESISKKTLQGIHKSTNIAAVDKYGEYIERIHKHGMAIFAGMIFGFDNDTHDVFENTYRSLEEWQIDIVEFNILTPYPGTAIYKRFEKEGRILTKDWSKYSQSHVVFQPKHMTPDDLLDGYSWMTKKFYSPDKMIKRIIHHFNYSRKKEYSLASLTIPSVNVALRSFYNRERKRIIEEKNQ